jgi:hypothetical protein
MIPELAGRIDQPRQFGLFVQSNDTHRGRINSSQPFDHRPRGLVLQGAAEHIDVDHRHNPFEIDRTLANKRRAADMHALKVKCRPAWCASEGAYGSCVPCAVFSLPFLTFGCGSRARA